MYDTFTRHQKAALKTEKKLERKKLFFAWENEVSLGLYNVILHGYAYKWHVASDCERCKLDGKKRKEQNVTVFSELSTSFFFLYMLSVWLCGGNRKRQTDTMEPVKFRRENVTDWFDAIVVVTRKETPFPVFHIWIYATVCTSFSYYGTMYMHIRNITWKCWMVCV